MKPTKHMCLLVILGAALVRPLFAAPPSTWEKPASELADQVAAILGPGQAHLTIRNFSTIPNDEIPAIRRLLTQDLKARGVVMAGEESANSIRITLSQDSIDGLWVAEVGEGNSTQVTMVRAGLRRGPSSDANVKQPITLRKQFFWSKNEAMPPSPLPQSGTGSILTASETNSGLVVVSDEGVGIYASSLGTWAFQTRLSFPERSSLPRDARAVLIPAADGNGFTAFTAGLACAGNYTLPTDPAAKPRDSWTYQYHASDDPWPIAFDASGAPQLKAFYNSARNYFTGVVSPSVGVDLPPFYAAVLLPRSAGNAALLIGGIDGKVQLAENGTLKIVTGTRDWGSDFAVLHSGCGAEVQVIASSSGEAPTDSLRAYELPALEAVPASAPLTMDGTVTALSTAPDGKSVLVVVRNAANQYEVDRVTALCN
ncbi:MAG: hypothetical protein ABSD59_10335 [Terracidiphilus sp.]